MASWQYRNPADKQPLVTTDQGYYVGFPYNRHEQPDNRRYTVELEFDGNRLYLWAHDIQFGFQAGGSSAQSNHYRWYYQRNMTQPTVHITGQTSNQEQYAEIAEWVRRSQAWALKPIDQDGRGNTIGLTIPHGGIQSHKHQGHHFRGHIKKIDRHTSVGINAPEFDFEFIVVTAYAGIFSVHTQDASQTLDRIAMYMQIPNTIRSQNGHQSGNVSFAPDPDPAFIDPKTGVTSNYPPNMK